MPARVVCYLSVRVRLCLCLRYAFSAGEARRLVANGGLYLNGLRVDSVDQPLRSSDVLGGNLVLRSGRKRHVVVTVV